MFKTTIKFLCVACLVGIPWRANAHISSPIPQSPPIEQPPLSAKKQALIEELLILTKQEETANQMLEAMLVQTEKTLPQFLVDTLSKTTGLTDQALQERVTELSVRMVRRYRELLPQRVDIGKITTQINSSLYAKYYTSRELQGLIDFYRTPLGQKTIEITPQLSQEALQQSNEILLPKMATIIQEIMKEELGEPPSHQDGSDPSPRAETDERSDPKK